MGLFTKLAGSTQHTPLMRRSSSSTGSPDALTNLFLRNLILPSSHRLVLIPVGNMNRISLGLENTCQGCSGRLCLMSFFIPYNGDSHQRLRLAVVWLSLPGSRAAPGTAATAGAARVPWDRRSLLGAVAFPHLPGCLQGQGRCHSGGWESACAADLISSD